MRQETSHPKKIRRKHCKCCGALFEPDPRAKSRQKYCSRAQCQTFRQRKNEKDWGLRNPDCVADQKHKWQQKHPGYSQQMRAANPELAQKNLVDTKIRMQKRRTQAVFDKSKVILTQLVDNASDKCCLMRGNWLFLRLKRASPWTKAGFMRHTGVRINRVMNRLPQGRFYDLSGMF